MRKRLIFKAAAFLLGSSVVGFYLLASIPASPHMLHVHLWHPQSLESLRVETGRQDRRVIFGGS